MSRLIPSFALAFWLLPQAALGAPGAPDWAAPQSSAGTPAPEPPAQARSTWDVAVAEPGICARAPDFTTQLAQTVPDERRPAPGAPAELRAVVRYGQARLATIDVVDVASGRTLGSREVPLADPSCDAAAGTISFVLAVLFQTEPDAQASRPPEPPPEPPPPPPPPPEPEPVVAAPRRRVTARYAWLGPRPAHELGAAAGVSLGLLPGVPVGGRGTWLIRPANGWRFGLWASGWSTTSADVADTRFGAAYGGVTLCPLHHETERFHLRGCAGLGAGAIWAHARDGSLYENDTWRKPFGLLGAEANAAVRIAGPLFAELGLRGDVALPRRTYYYVRTDSARRDIFRAAWVLGHLFVGLGLRFR
jgi:hypothetical protein